MNEPYKWYFAQPTTLNVMKNSGANVKVDAFFTRAKKWKEEMEALRALAAGSQLTEEFKWGKPCYTLNGGNVVLIHAFKEYCALLFFKGALLKDTRGILIQQTKNVQAARQLRFTSLPEIVKQQAVIKAYIKEAAELEKSGAEVTFKKTAEFEMPAEFEAVLKKNEKLKKAFKALTPGRQRGYLLYFAGARQAATRYSRIEKCTPGILAGKGLND